MFGEKGAGKTALRLQMAAQIDEHNAKNENGRLFVIEYDDFNPFLDRFADRLSGRKRRNAAKVLSEWKLWDHMDAILSLGVTSVVDRLLASRSRAAPRRMICPIDAARRLDRFQKRDLLLLAANYDNSLTETFQSRWYRLRRKLRYYPWQSWAIRLLGVVVTAAVAGVIIYNRQVGVAQDGLAVADHRPGLGAVADAGVAVVVPSRAACRRNLRVGQSRRPPAAAGVHAVLRPRYQQPAAARASSGPTTGTSCSTSSRALLEDARILGDRRAGRPRRRAASDERLAREYAGPGVVDARQQVPQAARAWG